jgi:hypothetical protein
MELKEFIRTILEQMEELKRIEQKKKYIVDELEFELSIQEIENNRIVLSVFGLGGEMAGVNQQGHKVKIKLKPKNRNRKYLVEGID